MKRLLLILGSVLLSVNFSITAFAANHYIRDGAVGGEPCSDWSDANACDALPATLIRGDTYYVADGTYAGYNFDDAESGVLVITVKKATGTDHGGQETGWLSSYGDGQALFTGLCIFKSSYWILDGVTGGGPSNNWVNNFGFNITETIEDNEMIRVGMPPYFPGGLKQANNIIIRHVELHGKGSVSVNSGGAWNDGISVYAGSDVLLSYFLIDQVGRCPFFLSGQNFIAEYGYIGMYYYSAAVHSEVAAIWSFGSGTVGDHTFRYTIFTQIQGTGGLIWDNSANPSAQLYAYGNIFYKSSGSTWVLSNGIISGWTGFSFANVRVVNNTFIDTETGGNMLGTAPGVGFMSNNVAQNNLFYSVAGPGGDVGWSTISYNHFINGPTIGTNSTTGSSDPFTNYVNLDFSLVTASSPINVGVNLGAPYAQDIVGLSRPQGATYDAGAYEFDQGGAGQSPDPPSGGSYLSSQRPASQARSAAPARALR